MNGSKRSDNIISDWIGLNQIISYWIRSDHIRVSRYEWIGSEGQWEGRERTTETGRHIGGDENYNDYPPPP